MEITLSRIAEVTGGHLAGDGSRVVTGVCSPGEARADRLCVVWMNELLPSVPAGVPVLANSLAGSGRDGVEFPSPRAAMVRLLPLFDRRPVPAPSIHPTAVIDDSADIGEGCYIGPCCVVSAGARVGAGCRLGAGVFVGAGASLGDGCVAEPGVVIMELVEIGNRVIMRSGTRIGCEGFGFVPTPEGHWERIPQIGTVVIEDDVEIGPNCSIDRAMFGVTRVGSGTKLGALVHIAHNCDIGRDCVMSGFTGFAGTSGTGDNVIIAGFVGVADHVRIGNRVTVAGRSGVTKNIPDGVTVAGYPAQEHMRENRFQAALRRVPSYGKRLKALEQGASSPSEEGGEV